MNRHRAAIPRMAALLLAQSTEGKAMYKWQKRAKVYTAPEPRPLWWDDASYIRYQSEDPWAAFDYDPYPELPLLTPKCPHYCDGRNLKCAGFPDGIPENHDPDCPRGILPHGFTPPPF